MSKCDRCREDAKSLRGSYFNTDMLCCKCIDKEIEHKDYEYAKKNRN